jgi:hypothetical protein
LNNWSIVNAEIKPAAGTNPSTSVSLTTTSANDVIYVEVVTDNTGTINTPTAPGLTFTLRMGPITQGTVRESTYYAIASSVLSGVSISESITGGGGEVELIAFGVSGANTGSPFDANAAVPASATGISTAGSVTISTSNANDLIIGAFGSNGGTTHSAASPWTLIRSVVGYLNDGDIEYQSVSAIQTNLAVTMTLTSANAWTGIADAIQSASTPGADVFVRNVGVAPTTLVSVYIFDQSSNTFVSQTAISTTVNVGAFVDIPSTTLTFTPSHGHTYSFTVTSNLGNSVTFYARAA